MGNVQEIAYASVTIKSDNSRAELPPPGQGKERFGTKSHSSWSSSTTLRSKPPGWRHQNFPWGLGRRRLLPDKRGWKSQLYDLSTFLAFSCCQSTQEPNPSSKLLSVGSLLGQIIQSRPSETGAGVASLCLLEETETAYVLTLLPRLARK